MLNIEHWPTHFRKQYELLRVARANRYRALKTETFLQRGLAICKDGLFLAQPARLSSCTDMVGRNRALALVGYFNS